MLPPISATAKKSIQLAGPITLIGPCCFYKPAASAVGFAVVGVFELRRFRIISRSRVVNTRRPEIRSFGSGTSPWANRYSTRYAFTPSNADTSFKLICSMGFLQVIRHALERGRGDRVIAAEMRLKQETTEMATDRLKVKQKVRSQKLCPWSHEAAYILRFLWSQRKSQFTASRVFHADRRLFGGRSVVGPGKAKRPTTGALGRCRGRSVATAPVGHRDTWNFSERSEKLSIHAPKIAAACQPKLPGGPAKAVVLDKTAASWVVAIFFAAYRAYNARVAKRPGLTDHLFQRIGNSRP